MLDLREATLFEIEDEIRSRFKPDAEGIIHLSMGFQRLREFEKSPAYLAEKAEAALLEKFDQNQAAVRAANEVKEKAAGRIKE